MEDLKILGKEKVSGFEFMGIEGGFGENKRAILANDIAKIHEKELFQVNRIIDEKRDRFKYGIDVIDLLNTSKTFGRFSEDKDLTKSRRTRHAYLLSERGYLKLLRFMNDDKAWDIYSDITDNYFNVVRITKKSEPKIIRLYSLNAINDDPASRRAESLMKLSEVVPNDKSTLRDLRVAYFETMYGDKHGQTTEEFHEYDDVSTPYTAAAIGATCNVTAMRVGQVANQLGLKAETQPGSTRFGKWIDISGPYAKRPVYQWKYSEMGFNAILQALRMQGE